MAVVIFLGRLGRDPEPFYTNGGALIVSFSAADDDVYTPKGQERKPIWRKCKAFGRNAETILEHAKKGALLFISGTLQQNTWTDKENNVRVEDVIEVERFRFAGGPKSDEAGAGGGTTPASKPVPPTAEDRAQTAALASATSTEKANTDPDDDLPF
jgi:single-strand DNA-binding protein